MSPFDRLTPVAQEAGVFMDSLGRNKDDSVMRAVADRLAAAIEQREATQPSANPHDFRVALANTLTDLALEDLTRLEQLSGVALLQRLSALHAMEHGEVSQEQAQWLGAFEEHAIDQTDCDEMEADDE